VGSLIAVAKLIGGPGSIGFLVLLVAAALVWGFVWPKRRRDGVIALTLTAGVYTLLSLPAVAAALADRLPSAPLPDTRIREIEILFVFGGDNELGRIREAKRICHMARPQAIWLLDAAYMRDDLRMVGVPPNRIHIDSSAWNTQTQIDRVAEVLRASPTARAAILASRLQAPRIALLTAYADLQIPIAPSPLDRDLPSGRFESLVPSYSALLSSRDAIYENVALAYYRSVRHPERRETERR
jgi:uncharacterized SAM-binding protein YcdF (DUF218 family)